MKFIETNISGIVICEPEVFGDERRYFFESFNQKEFERFVGVKVDFCQDNESKSSYGVLRGLHFQNAPHAQSKLVRVIEGEVLDVAVDLRSDSKTYGQNIAVKLSGDNKKQLFIPKGFAHGYVVLSEAATFSYKVDNYYKPDAEMGLAFDDIELNIDWIVPNDSLKINKRDSNHPNFKSLIVNLKNTR